MAAKTVTIGDQTYSIGRFSTFKALRAGKLLTEIMRALPGLSDEMTAFAAEYREKNVIRLSRAAAELRYPPEDLERISETAWEQSGGDLVLPAAPGPLEMAAHVFPRVFDEANDRVLELLALIAVPNSTLRDADQNDTVGEVLAAEKKRLEHSDLDELLDLLAAAGEVIEEQFSGKVAVLRKVASSFGFQMAGPETEAASETTPTPSKPSTSIGSGEPTDGPETSPSTDSPSSTSPVSSTA